MRQLRILALAVIGILGSSVWMVAQDRNDQGRNEGGYYQQGSGNQDHGISDRDRAAYQEGMRQGGDDARRGVRPQPRPEVRYKGRDSERDRRAFNAGYDRGYDDVMAQSQRWAENSAYQQGLKQGQFDAQHNRGLKPRPGRLHGDLETRAFLAGYDRGYHETAASSFGINIGGLGILFQSHDNARDNPPERDNPQGNQPQDQNNAPSGSLSINGNNVSWQSQSPNSSVFVQVDNKAEQLFASGSSGTQAASWMERGHMYVFILKDSRGNELARNQIDMRR